MGGAIRMHKLQSSLLAIFTLTFFGPLFAASEGNPIKGAELFKQCAACHAIGEGAANGVGPQLNHVFGRPAASIADFAYSEPMKAKADEEDLLWHEETMYTFLAGPQFFVKGTTMGFPGLRREQEIRDLLAYLIQFSPAYEAESETTASDDAIAAATLPPPPSADEEEEVPEFTAEYLALGDAIKTGGDLWGKQCRHCHGNSAYPGKAPKLTPATYKPEFVFDRLTNGFRKMPAWKTVFSLEERKSIVAYVLSGDFSP